MGIDLCPPHLCSKCMGTGTCGGGGGGVIGRLWERRNNFLLVHIHRNIEFSIYFWLQIRVSFAVDELRFP
jgi:hypothetical protein